MNNNEPNVTTEPIAPVTPTTPTQVENTQSTEAKVDIQAILKQAEDKANEIADKKARAVFEDMIKQQNPDMDKETIKKMADEWKSKQVTPEQLLEEEKTKNVEMAKRLEVIEQEKIALLKGVPLSSEDEAEKEKVNACLTLAKSYVNDETTFEVALDKALKVISFEKPQTPPNFYSGGGATQVNKINKEDYKDYDKKMELKQKNPKLYEELFPDFIKKK